MKYGKSYIESFKEAADAFERARPAVLPHPTRIAAAVASIYGYEAPQWSVAYGLDQGGRTCLAVTGQPVADRPFVYPPMGAYEAMQRLEEAREARRA